LFFAIFKGKILNLGRGKDPGSEIQDTGSRKNHPRSWIQIPDPLGKKAPDPGSGTLDKWVSDPGKDKFQYLEAGLERCLGQGKISKGTV
jgi:hypothetical protein